MKEVIGKARLRKNRLRKNWPQVILPGLGVLMIGAAVAVGVAHGFSFPKLLIGLSGLLILAAAKSGKRFVGFYKSAAVILLNTLALLIFLEMAAAAILWLWPEAGESRLEAEGYYQSQEWGAGYLHDSELAPGESYEPYVIWKKKPYESQYLGVDKDGNRVTPGARCGKDSYVVFMFGGSTMWGTGVPDWGTIPAYIQAQMSVLHKEPVCVRNFGQPAWVSTQGVIELLRHLQAGEVPNLVIFYDGINDVGIATTQGVAGGHDDLSLIRTRLENDNASRNFMQLIVRTKTFGLLERFFPISGLRDWPSDYNRPTHDPEVLGAKVTRAYLTNYRGVKAIASDFGFDYGFFWQPTPDYELKPLTAEEKEIENAEEADKKKLINVVYPQVKAATREDDHVLYISDVFNNTTERVYLDDAHLTPGGNEKVAKRMMELLVRMERSSAKSAESKSTNLR